jgi:RimJ/RimL family protein N-acetyltransferase
MIQSCADGRLIGYAKLDGIGWAHGFARLELGIGDPADRGRGYGSEALNLILRYAFDELNLHRVAAVTCSYNSGALHWLERTGFVTEVRQREAIKRTGQRWDLVHLAILRPEWETNLMREGAQ